MTKRLGLPAVRLATRQAMRVLGNHFVLGQTIGEALARAGNSSGRDRYSFDMLGEGARTGDDARHYYDSYAEAIDAIGRAEGHPSVPDRSGISVKLSALHPRYEPLNRARVLRELVPLLIELARKAKSYELNFTVDAEEADRLELSLDVIDVVARDPSLAGWDGFGLAVQAYQKRAPAVIDWVDELSRSLNRRLHGAASQGRLLGHGNQARAGARPCGLPGVYAQGDDRPSLPGVRAPAAQAASAYLSPVCQRITRSWSRRSLRNRGSGGRLRFQRLHGMGEALYLTDRSRNAAGRGMSGSVAGRRAQKSRSHIWCGGCSEKRCKFHYIAEAADPCGAVGKGTQTADGYHRHARAAAPPPLAITVRNLFPPERALFSRRRVR